MQLLIAETVVAHSAEADFCCCMLRIPTPKEMCYNDLLNQIAINDYIQIQLQLEIESKRYYNSS